MQFKTIDGKKIPLGAGIAIFKNEDNCAKILCLEVSGENDIPKGIIESGESKIEAAIRETREEASLMQESYRLLFSKKTNRLATVNSDTITCFIGLINDNIDPFIKPNPDTGIMEHDSWSWVDRTEMLSNCKECLVEIVNSAFSIFEKSINKEEESFVYF